MAAALSDPRLEPVQPAVDDRVRLAGQRRAVLGRLPARRTDVDAGGTQFHRVPDQPAW
jgi:hypothetical protein